MRLLLSPRLVAPRVMRPFQAFIIVSQLTRRSSGLSVASKPGPLRELERLVAAGKLQPDTFQFDVAQKLQALHDELVEYEAKRDEIQRQQQGLKLSKLSRKARQRALEEGIQTADDQAKHGSLTRVRQEDDEEQAVVPLGLYIHGEVGCGKTLLMDLFYDNAPTTMKKRMHFGEFMLFMYSSMNKWQFKPGRSDDEHPVREIAEEVSKDAWLICFDEFMITDVATCAILNQFFTAMFEKGVVIVTTSNRHPDDLYQGLFQRDLFESFVLLLKQKCELHSVASERDYRALSLEKEISRKDFVRPYFVGPDGTKSLLEYIDPYYLVLDFEEVCGSRAVGKYGPISYAEISRTRSKVAITNVPSMGPDRKNDCRRLIMLIDALYEAKVKLAISAETEPDLIFKTGTADPSFESADKTMHLEMLADITAELLTNRDVHASDYFTAHEEIFAFRRAASRLKEMQTVAYASLPHRPPTMSFAESSQSSIRAKNVTEDKISPAMDDFASEADYRRNRRRTGAPQFGDHHFFGMTDDSKPPERPRNWSTRLSTFLDSLRRQKD